MIKEILLKILEKMPDTRSQRNNVDINFTIHDFYKINEAIKELEELNSVLIDLFTCIEFTEDENAEKRLSSMETYLIRLARFKSE